jgi:hypothetical protein
MKTRPQFRRSAFRTTLATFQAPYRPDVRRAGLWVPVALLMLAVSMTAMADDAKPPTFERMKYNNPGLTVDLGVGLWGWPLPLDFDHDGDFDLLVSCPDVPYNGTYFFENPDGESANPVFKPGVRIGPALRNVALSFVDGKPRILTPAHELTAVLDGDLSTNTKLYDKTVLHGRKGENIRANQWSYVDYDGDGAVDLIAGHGLWSDYGWDNAFDAQGQWTRGPLHGHVYLLKNKGTTEQPDYESPQQLNAAEEPIDVYGMPSPNFADFDGDGDLDLICGDFLDGFTWFQNIGSRNEPTYAAGRELSRNGTPINMHLCMIVVSSIDWDRDGDVDLIVGQEDGRVAFIEHTGEVDDGMPVFAEPRFFQQQADDVKFGALVTPVSFDWDADGDEDLVCGNTAGEIAFIENLDGGNPPKWAAPQVLKVDGEPIRIMAGDNGSIQGPAESKWGYTTISVVDWDHDGLLDVLANSIWGKVVWYRNVGTRKAPQLSAARPVQVAWKTDPPKPEWNWWNPVSGELAPQWRTTPSAVDWNRDGLVDLVMLDHEGYLAFFRREQSDDGLVLHSGQRVFRGGAFDNRQRSHDSRSGVLRLNTGTAGKSGRRKICIVDWNRDGKLDLLVNSVNVNLLEQTTTIDGVTTFTDRGPLISNRLAGHTTSPTTTDWDGDGNRELLIGAEDGYFYIPVSGIVGGK